MTFSHKPLTQHASDIGLGARRRRILGDLANAVTRIDDTIDAGGLTVWDDTGSENSFDEIQTTIDRCSHDLFAEVLRRNPSVRVLVSEEGGTRGINQHGAYSVAVDPIDGSREGKSNKTTGSIFCIFKGGVMGRTPREIALAGYALYGKRTEFVYTPGHGRGVHAFVRNKAGGFVFNYTLPRLNSKGRHVGPGNLAAMTCDGSLYLPLLHRWAQERKSLRYSGCLVSDMHDIFVKGGGVFMYPGGCEHEAGKLRLAFECGPLAFVAHELGGWTSNGTKPILDVEIETFDQRCEFIAGSEDDVIEIERQTNLHYKKLPVATDHDNQT